MPELYFSKFPQIEYANSVCVDITKRVALNRDLRYSPIVFDNYELKNSSRADIIAENYYEDSAMEWVLWLTNGIVDPYYGWNLTDEDFNAHLIKKYGSVEYAQKKIAYYRNNWRYDDRELTPSYYNSTLPDNLKKYYTPVFNDGLTILSYARKNEDIVVNTNKLYNLDISLSSNAQFVVGEIVDVKSTSPVAIVGGGEVVFANSTVVKVKNISGNLSATNSLIGETSNATATITASTLLSTSIPDDEAVFWEAVYVYDVEYDKNEKNRSIQLMNPAYAKEMSYNMRSVFRK